MPFRTLPGICDRHAAPRDAPGLAGGQSVAEDADRAMFRARLGTLAKGARHLGVPTSGIAKALARAEATQVHFVNHAPHYSTITRMFARRPAGTRPPIPHAARGLTLRSMAFPASSSATRRS